jgi:23S rRNA maturation-related 3'-5' exoribonuclease YhaM
VKEVPLALEDLTEAQEAEIITIERDKKVRSMKRQAKKAAKTRQMWKEKKNTVEATEAVEAEVDIEVTTIVIRIKEATLQKEVLILSTETTMVLQKEAKPLKVGSVF